MASLREFLASAANGMYGRNAANSVGAPSYGDMAGWKDHSGTVRSKGFLRLDNQAPQGDIRDRVSDTRGAANPYIGPRLGPFGQPSGAGGEQFIRPSGGEGSTGGAGGEQFLTPSAGGGGGSQGSTGGGNYYGGPMPHSPSEPSSGGGGGAPPGPEGPYGGRGRPGSAKRRAYKEAHGLLPTQTTGGGGGTETGGGNSTHATPGAVGKTKITIETG